jgi:hypothetical protein
MSTLLLYDQFTTDLAAGSVNGTSAEPGPGTRVVSDSGSKLSISSSKLTASGSTATNNPRYSPTSSSQARAAGMALRATLNFTNVNSFGFGFHTTNSDFDNVIPGMITGGATDAYMRSGGGATLALPFRSVLVTATQYVVSVLLRSTGAFLIINDLLEWVDNTGTQSPLFPGLASRGAAWAGTADDFRLVQLDAPWTADSTIATSLTASPASGATGTMTANAFVEFTWTAATGATLELDVRRTDANNRWCVRCSQAGSTIKLIEINAGVETERASAAQTWNNGTAYRILVACDGNTIRNYVSNTAKNNYASASFNNTATGIAVAGFTTGANLIAWPRSMTITEDAAGQPAMARWKGSILPTGARRIGRGW